MPEVYVIYISETNLWKTGHTEDPVRKHLDGQKEDTTTDYISCILIQLSMTAQRKLL